MIHVKTHVEESVRARCGCRVLFYFHRKIVNCRPLSVNYYPGPGRSRFKGRRLVIEENGVEKR
jgi:hypothetical protein